VVDDHQLPPSDFEPKSDFEIDDGDDVNACLESDDDNWIPQQSEDDDKNEPLFEKTNNVEYMQEFHARQLALKYPNQEMLELCHHPPSKQRE